MSTVRCLAISNSYPPDHAGGYEIGACNILENLAEHYGWRNTILSAVRKEKSPKTDALELNGFFPGWLGPEVQLWRTKRAVLKQHAGLVEQMRAKASEADLVFVFNPRRLIYPQWTSVLDVGIPAFVFVSDHWPNNPMASDIFYSRSKKHAEGRLKNEALQGIYSAAPDGSDLHKRFRGVLFGSRFLQSEQAAVFADNAHQLVSHWGIDADRFPRVAFSAQRLKTLGFCGRPEKEKGLELALDAVRELASFDEAIRLIVACDLQTNAYGRSIAKRVNGDPILKKRVRLLGAIPYEDLHKKFYSRIGTLLFPSTWQEPFALTVLEAMASGVLVIASSTGGTPEVVDSTTGYLFDPKVEGDLLQTCRAALSAELTDLQRRVQNGSTRIRESHTLKSMARKVDGFVRALL